MKKDTNVNKLEAIDKRIRTHAMTCIKLEHIKQYLLRELTNVNFAIGASEVQLEKLQKEFNTCVKSIF